jgi:tetratricopeptide (TPR) repeat protein
VDRRRRGRGEARHARRVAGSDAPHVLRTLGYSASRSISGARPHPREALPEWLRAQDAKDTLRAAAEEIAQQRYEEAIRLATECLAVLPRNAEAVYVRGFARERFGDARAAREDYERAVSIDPSYVAALAALAVLDERENRNADGLERWTTVLRLDPDHELALLRAGKAWAARGAFDTALPLLTHLASRHPDNVAYAFDAGFVAREAGRIDDAKRHFDAFLLLAPDDPQAAQTRQWLEQVGASARRKP